VKYLRRLLSFFASRLIAFTAVVALLILAFYLAMNTANIYVLLGDGMKLRASVILTREGAEELPNFFADEFLTRDETLSIGLSNQSPYIDYKITSFNYELSMEWMWSWPWEDRAQAVIVERVPRIVGSVLSEKKDLVKEGTLSANPPAWYGGRYAVTLVRAGGQWKIAGLTLRQMIVEPTETPSASPTPAPAPAP